MNIFETTPPGRGNTHRPILWICLSFILGIVINEHVNPPIFILFFLIVLFLLLSLLTFQKRISSIFMLVSFIFIGSVYSHNYQTFPSNHISKISYSYRQDPVVVEGIVVSDVEPRPFFKGKKTVFTLEAKRIKSKWGWKEKSGPLLVNLFRPEDIKYGDYLILEGKLHKPFNFSSDTNFSYRDYLYRQGITFILSIKKDGRVETLKRNQGNLLADLSFRFKHRLINILRKYLPKTEAGIMQAFLLGDRYDIPKNFYDLYKLSGVAHIIAISGFNIGIVSYVIFLILKMFPIPRQAQYVVTMLLLIFYAFLTGGQPPVVRATIMAVIFLASFLIEREQESINTLSLSALILLFRNPLNLFDVGFQLSFISVLFIILFYSRLLNLFYKFLPAFKAKSEKGGIKPWMGRYLLQSAALSLVVYFGVVPLVVYYFHLVTPIVILANLVIVPLSSLIIFLGMGLLIMGGLLPFLAFAFANCIVLLLNLMVVIVFFFTQLPGAYFKLINFSIWLVFLYYGLMFMVIVYRSSKNLQGIIPPLRQ